MKSVLSALLMLAALAAAVCADEFIWIEGESSTDTDFNRHGWYEGGSRHDLMSPGEVETTDGAWLAHYFTGDPSNTAYAAYDFTVSEGGSYTWWIRLNPILANYSYSIGPAFPTVLDARDHRELVNLVGPVDDPGIDIRWLGWVKAAEFSFTPGESATLRVEVNYNGLRGASHGGIDCMVLVNYPWEPVGVLQPDQVITPPGPDVWFPLKAWDDPFSPESITDMRGLWHAPAGQYGWLDRQGAALEFRDRPGQPVKFWGTNTGELLATQEMQTRQARYYAKHGINLFRFHPLMGYLGPLENDGTGGRQLNPMLLDDFDRWFSIIKENGIYLTLSAFYPHIVTPDDGYPANLYAELGDQGGGKSSSGVVAFMTALQDAEWEWLEALLEHVNPYTGLAYKDEPALAFIEVHNEDSIFWHWPLNELGNPGGSLPLHRAELQRQWMQWVATRYGDDVALAAAWGAGMRAGDSVSNPAMDIYGAWQMAADGPDWGVGAVQAERPRLGDFVSFLAETQRAYYERRQARLRAAGWQGVFVTTAWRAGGPAAQAANMWSDDAGDAIDRHAYWGGGGTQSWRLTRGDVNNASHLDIPGYGIVGGHVYDSGGVDVELFQVEDKPVIMSEWTSSPANEWKAEAVPLWAFYGMGLQGWDVSLHFAGSRPRMGSGWPWNAWSPSFYVTETPHYIGQFPALVFAIHNGHFQEAGLAAARRLVTEDLFGGFDPLSQDLPAGGWPSEPNLITPPEVMAIGRLTFKADATGLPSAKIDWDSYWDQGARSIDSTTGELHWDYGRPLVIVQSEKTQGLVGWAGGGSWDLPGVGVEVTTGFVSLLFTPLDDRPLIESQHILVTALARDRQLNAIYDADPGSVLLQVGGPPLLLEPVQASITFKGDPIVSARSVDIHGVPTATALPIAANTISIDGSYESYYYEVRRQDVCAPYLARSQATTASPLDPPLSDIFLTTPGADGITLNPTALHAEVPYVCSFLSADPDPDQVLDPLARPLVFYQMSDDIAGAIWLVKDLGVSSVRIHY